MGLLEPDSDRSRSIGNELQGCESSTRTVSPADAELAARVRRLSGSYIRRERLDVVFRRLIRFIRSAIRTATSWERYGM
jgi:hypothetical protein